MEDTHFQIQLTAILDGLMKTAVSDICALTDSWVQALQMEIRRSQKENQDLRQKLYNMEQQPPPAAAAETQPEEKSEIEEAPINTEPTNDTSKKAGNAETESSGFKRGQWCVMIQKWNPVVSGSKAQVVDRSISQIEEELDCNARTDDTVLSPTCEDKVSHTLYELKTELEKPEAGLQKPEHSLDVTAGHEYEHDYPAVLDQNNETESQEDFPQPKTEEEDEFDVTCLLIPDLQPSSTHLQLENHSQSTNSDCRMDVNVENNLNVPAMVPNTKHFSESTSVSLAREKEIRSMFICSICGKTLTTKRSFMCHMRVHTGERPFTCTQCGKRFAKKFNLDIHYNIHTGARPYACSLCPRSFADPSAFGRHKMMHRKKLLQEAFNPKNTFVCNICGQSFLSRSSLAVHCRLHTAEKQHSAQKVVYRTVH